MLQHGKDIESKINPKKAKSPITKFSDLSFSLETDDLPETNDQASPKASPQQKEPKTAPEAPKEQKVPKEASEQLSEPQLSVNKLSKKNLNQKREEFLQYLVKIQDTKETKTFRISQQSLQRLDIISRIFAASSSNIIDNLINKLYTEHEDVISQEIKKLGDKTK